LKLNERGRKLIGYRTVAQRLVCVYVEQNVVRSDQKLLIYSRVHGRLMTVVAQRLYGSRQNLDGVLAKVGKVQSLGIGTIGQSYLSRSVASGARVD
jgi:hypothetical protein